MKDKKESEFVLKEEESSNHTSASVPKQEGDREATSTDFKLYKIRWPI